MHLLHWRYGQVKLLSRYPLKRVNSKPAATWQYEM
jgi:hypothetical protein